MGGHFRWQHPLQVQFNRQLKHRRTIGFIPQKFQISRVCLTIPLYPVFRHYPGKANVVRGGKTEIPFGATQFQKFRVQLNGERSDGGIKNINGFFHMYFYRGGKFQGVGTGLRGQCHPDGSLNGRYFRHQLYRFLKSGTPRKENQQSNHSDVTNSPTPNPVIQQMNDIHPPGQNRAPAKHREAP